MLNDIPDERKVPLCGSLYGLTRMGATGLRRLHTIVKATTTKGEEEKDYESALRGSVTIF